MKKASTSIQTKKPKCNIHWDHTGPFGGSTSHTACGFERNPAVDCRKELKEVTCKRCLRVARIAMDNEARRSRGIE